uniref:Translation initiation factor IF-2, chloroplastic n=1 Tax=Laurenciella marilzae TaxID=1413812 RepID=A0A1Z1M115_9FLOR|nr:translation initiation factor 2 [Laurenciella marilzae]ARW59797.1 translation initiation factor 2 [Laurenciella marilzae]
MYQSYSNFYLLFSKNYLRCITLYSFEYSESVLNLDLPKLISLLDSKLTNLITVSESSKVIKGSTSNSGYVSYDLNKSYKDNNYSQEDIESKKNKNKIIKKKRTTSHSLSSHDIFVDTSDDLFSSNSLDSSLLKSRKLNSKTKKKNKLKTENLSSTRDLLNTTSDSIGVTSLNPYLAQNAVVIDCPVTVEQLSLKLNMTGAEIITHLFLDQGISVTINQILDVSIAKQVASHYNFTLLDLSDSSRNVSMPEDNLSSFHNVQRPPVITILGHVDHGKTTLLDAILETNLVTKESGGITQAIRGYEMQFQDSLKTYKLIFLDTPGHQSFKEMRFRGAKITDIVLLVIACDDGLKPQTIEAINYIKEMNLYCVVVITKTDTSDKNIDFILNDLATYGLIYEKRGGNLKVVQVSALTGRNINILLSEICQICDLKSFVANPDQLATGTILESYLDKKQGPIAYLLVQNGTLKVGDIAASSGIYGKVKSIVNSSTNKVTLAAPSSVVQVLGFPDLLHAGSVFKVVNNDKEAKEFCASYLHPNSDLSLLKGLDNSVHQSFASDTKQVKLLIKADTQGSLEAVIDLLFSIPQSKVKLRIVSASVGIVANSDIELAIVSQSIIVAFNMDISSGINNLIKKNNLIFKKFRIIYNLFEYVKDIMLDLIEPSYEKVFIGRASVRTVFNMNRGSVAGCYVDQGKLIKMCHIRVYRRDQIVYEGILSSLKIIKDNVSEVLSDHECGLMCDYNLWQKDDIIDAYELVPQKKTLQ